MYMNIRKKKLVVKFNVKTKTDQKNIEIFFAT